MTLALRRPAARAGDRRSIAVVAQTPRPAARPGTLAAAMIRATRRATLDIPPADLMAILTAVRDWPTTMPFVQSVEPLGPGAARAAPGARYALSRTKYGETFDSVITVLRADADHFEYLTISDSDRGGVR